MFETEIRNSGKELQPGVYDEYRRLVNVELEKLQIFPHSRSFAKSAMRH